MVSTSLKGPNPVFPSALAPLQSIVTELVLHRAILEKEKDQMLSWGYAEGTDCFRSPFRTKGTGEAESQKSNRLAKGKEESKLNCWRSHQRWEPGARSSCWLADGTYLQHRGLPRKDRAAASSRYMENAACERKRDAERTSRSTILHRPVYSISPLLQAKGQGVSSSPEGLNSG